MPESRTSSRRSPRTNQAWLASIARFAGAALLLLGLLVAPSPWTLPTDANAPVFVRAVIVSQPQPGAAGTSGSATVELLEGTRIGERLTASVDQASDIAGSIPYNKGDEVLLTQLTDASGGEVFAVADRSRGGALLVAMALFALAVIGIAGAVGARSLLGLVVTGIVLVRFGIPALLSGASPLVVAGLIVLVVGVASVVITEGLNRRATATILGIGGSLVAVALISILLDRLLAFTPFAGDPDLINLIPILGGSVDLRGIGLAAAMIGTLGIVDDVAATQVAAVEQIRRADLGAGALEVGRRALAIGRSHVGAVINTLPLAYFAASLPLVVAALIAPGGLAGRLSTETVAVEVVRALAGTAGVLLAMPLATVSAVLIGVGEE
ncbi:MAG: YibE/F family protein [Candidatus Limnocylindrus sp.]